MSKKEAEQKIKKALAKVDNNGSDLWTMGNLERVAKVAGVDLYYVMMVIRYGRIL